MPNGFGREINGEAKELMEDSMVLSERYAKYVLSMPKSYTSYLEISSYLFRLATQNVTLESLSSATLLREVCS